MCSSHLIRHNVELFLDKLITGYEKWILYENIKRKESYCKPGTFSNSSKTKYPSTKSTALFVVGQERSSVLRVAETGGTINADLYCNQLDKLNAAIKGKRPTLVSRKVIVFHHDNARPHTAMVTTKTECARMGSPWSPTVFT
ncbi:mariner Mos1 transposase [Trichonephila clavipes]|nr:mariner Mos1 transposase [Trichonephila clavipes]